MTSIIVVSLLVAVAVFYFAAIKPARVIKGWLVALANGEKLPTLPAIGWRVWLYPLHHEAEGIARKIDEIRAGTEKSRKQLRDVEFIQHFVLASLIEGIMVVDESRRVTLINPEFLNLFQLEQSPIGQTVREVFGDSKLDGIVGEVFATGKVQSGRVSKQSSTNGRPPSFEVSAVPVRMSETHVESVVVIFLPPPDRPRMVQILKQHTEKLNRLADDWTVMRGGVRMRTSIADLPDPASADVKVETPSLRDVETAP